ncbi:MAG: hypothetical protein ABIQ95_01485 [Bdellovibrionia bacterium]
MKKIFLVFGVSLILSASAFAEGEKKHGPCKEIREACTKAGFKKGDWKNGDGLFRDCINPIMQGVTTVPSGKLPLPSVDAAIVAACKAKKPKFGEGKVGSK